MLLLAILLILLLLFAGFGITVHFLWWLALVVLVVMLVCAFTGRFL